MISLDHATVAFRHELARQAVESSLSPLRRQALHAQVLQTFLAQGEDPSQAARLVHHALGANDGVLAARYALLAAQQSSAQGAHREAAAHYATVLQDASRLPLERQAELLEGRAYECYLTSQIAEAVKAYQAALRIWRQLARPGKIGQTLLWLSRLHWFLGESDAAKKDARDAVQLLETLAPDRHLAMAYSNKAHLAMLADNTAEAVNWGERAIALAEQLGDTETLVHALNNIGTALLAAQDRRGQAHLERSLQLALEQGWEEHIARAYTNLACCAILARDYRRAAPLLQKGLIFCTERNLDACGAHLLAWQARASLEQGLWDDATQEATRVLEQYRISASIKIPALLVLGAVRLRRGAPDGLPLLEEAFALVRASGEPSRMVPLAALRAEAAWLDGNLALSLAEGQTGYELALAHPDSWRLGELSLWMRRAGGLVKTARTLAEPYARQIAGDWQGAAALWEKLNRPWPSPKEISRPALPPWRCSISLARNRRRLACADSCASRASRASLAALASRLAPIRPVYQSATGGPAPADRGPL